ncbi:hypothetical protein [Thermococcus sp. 21S7]|uniref:hypothetical protein n=1 Tax=Thermococcus sp. 21S7 TaxID=1638221 RepID=UPI001438FC69|nr:hypothetical protein [Thermococcus sp. 21S7]NJE61066.1 hypothetical protein [Thermococcus sp. 21S7]
MTPLKKWMAGVFAAVFAVLVLSSLTGALSIIQPKGNAGSMMPAEAMLVAQRHLQWASSNLPGFEDWKNAKLSQPVVYYFPNGTKSAYELKVSPMVLYWLQRRGTSPLLLSLGKGRRRAGG